MMVFYFLQHRCQTFGLGTPFKANFAEVMAQKLPFCLNFTLLIHLQACQAKNQHAHQTYLKFMEDIPSQNLFAGHIFADRIFEL